MLKHEGIHFYINIKNYNDIIESEENATGNVTHSIHALDTYFSAVEKYATGLYKDLVIEKITGSRLHMYIIGEINYTFDILWKISIYARSLSKFIKDKISKYKSLEKFGIQIGAAYGPFYEYEFKNKQINELTTIGYAANFAAKLQNLTKENYLSISKNLYDSLTKSTIKAQFTEVKNAKILKYGEESYYEILLKETDKHFDEDIFEIVLEIAKRVNLNDISFSEARRQISFDNLSLTECKKLLGIPLFADVRGFTTLFKKDNSNLKEMADKTSQILEQMYNVVTLNKGLHIQFQGDREVAFYHDYPSYNCIRDAILSGLRLIDSVKGFSVSIGVGQSYGRVYATKIGARGYKDNLLIGRVVNEADYLEDDCAEENELAISEELYELLKKQDGQLARIFSHRNDYYVTKYGYNLYLENMSFHELESNNKKRNYNGAWNVR